MGIAEAKMCSVSRAWGIGRDDTVGRMTRGKFTRHNVGEPR